MKIGLVSDTHGRLDGALWTLFGAGDEGTSGVETILHAGDVGDFHLVRELGMIAPVTAIRGNIDPWDARIPEETTVAIGGLRIRIVHAQSTHRDMLARAARRFAADIVLFGHTHIPFIAEVDGTLFVNPGSASRSRGAGISAGILAIEDGRPRVTIHDLRAPGLPITFRWPAEPDPAGS